MQVATAPITEEDADELPSYLRSSGGTLFGGETVADDLARRGRPRYDDLDLADDEQDEDDLDISDETTMSSFVHGALVVGQCIVAVLFGAGLFIAFDQLWKWNNIIALVLSVLVILGLVVGVRVVRKTEDIGSTLIAVAVGALVTLGPLALLQSG
jgi:F0F1-type ATP synthase assembly protein I